LVANIARNIRKVLLSHLADLTTRAVVGSVAVLGTPLFVGGYLIASFGFPAQTVNAQIVEAVATPSSPAIMLCDQLGVNDGKRSTEKTASARMPTWLSQDRWTYAQMGLHCGNQVR
jgi:hypothetical protein